VKPIDHEGFINTLRKYLPEKTSASAASPSKALTAAAAATAMSPAVMSDLNNNPTLAKLMSKPATAKLVEKFLAGLPQRVTSIQQALQAGEMNQVKVLAHQLKGAAGGYGFLAITKVSTALEAAVISGADKSTVAAHIVSLATLCAQVRGIAA
jgi:HPt (histidine-containing phosphotransfer) domain-containing protein